ncbi:hypothetical protein KEM55_000627 [Ascosphaera atra]|nr:hypothetical protein KEM55_000627 [Ascosphaera atra]
MPILQRVRAYGAQRIVNMRTRSQSKASKENATTHATAAAVNAEAEKGRISTEVEDNYPKPIRQKRRTTTPTPHRKKRAKAGSAHSNLSTDPFPDWPSPTPEECEEVNRLLSDVHGHIRAPSPGLLSSGKVEGSRSILHSLVRTILSCNTTNANSLAAARGLAEKFPGSGKGR